MTLSVAGRLEGWWRKSRRWSVADAADKIDSSLPSASHCAAFVAGKWRNGETDRQGDKLTKTERQRIERMRDNEKE